MSTALAPLWAIEEDLVALLDSVALCPEDLQPELQAQIEKYLGHEIAKVDQIAHVLAAMEYEQKCAADEIARLQERRKAAAKAQERLEAYVCRVIAGRGVKKLAGKTNTLSVRPSDAVVITDESKIPAQYRDVTITMMADDFLHFHMPEMFIEHGAKIAYSTRKADVKKALKSGEDIPGADLEFRNNLERK